MYMLFKRCLICRKITGQNSEAHQVAHPIEKRKTLLTYNVQN